MRDKIIDYKIVSVWLSDKDPSELIVEYIHKGFQPSGSLAMFYDDHTNDVYYSQCMVKYEDR